MGVQIIPGAEKKFFQEDSFLGAQKYYQASNNEKYLKGPAYKNMIISGIFLSLVICYIINRPLGPFYPVVPP